MNSPEYRQCTRCVMDTSDPDITFNAKGECNHCTEFLEKRARYKYQGAASDEQLAQWIVAMKAAGKGREFDCVVGLSGGIDSSYAAFIAREHGLRVLAVHMDNGWNAEEAVQNIKNIADKLHVEYESYVLDWEEFRDLQVAFLRASVPEADTPTDIAILSALHKVAARYGVKHIISGGNFATEGILPKTWHYNAKDLTYFNHIYKRFGKGKLKTFPTFGFLSEMYYKLVKKIKMVYILNYVPFDKNEAMALLERELDWKYYGGKHYESKYTGFIQAYYLYEKFGIDYRRATYSSQICAGALSREEALELLKSKPYKDEQIEEEKRYIAKKLGLSSSDFDEILHLPPKWYRDYPNDEKRLDFVYNTYRKLFRKEKLGSF
ncbi:MAG: N-acetyl sugar amidotransferase [Cryomorphaceae bacterium]|nr:N-acetyl sugar amidotransferase [Cryomorphaceae bacterium]